MSVWKLLKSDDGYFFMDENARKSDTYFFAKKYKQGYAIVQKEENGSFQFIDINGNLSQPFDFAEDYQNGFALVKEEGCSRYRFRDLDGKLSRTFIYAESYREGFAVVKITDNPTGPFYFIDKNGNLSKQHFYYAESYSKGFAVISHGRGQPYQFRDLKGNISSDSYFMALKYDEYGFARVLRHEQGQLLYRDIVGNVTISPTKAGKDYCAYLRDLLTVYELPDVCFADEKMVSGIIQYEKNLFLQAKENCITEQELISCKERRDEIIEYISERAYEQHEKNSEYVL